MPKRLSSTLLFAVALTATSCSASMKKPDIKNNPNPIQRYEMTVTVKGAPGSFETTNGFVSYDIANVECVPEDSFTGGRPVPDSSHFFELEQVDQQTWKGYFYRDLVQDADYYGLGVCHWELGNVSPNFVVGGTIFGPALMRKDILQQKSQTRFYRKKDFRDHQLHGAAPEQRATDEDVTTHPDDYLSITVSAREAKS